MNFNTQSVIKAAIIGAVINSIIGILSGAALLLPTSAIGGALGIITGLLACCGWAAIPVGTGALYGYFTPGKETLGQAAGGGAVSGVVAGLLYGVVNAVVQGGVLAYQSSDIATALTGSAGALIGGCCGAFIVGGILGAIGGAIWTAVQGNK